MATTSHPWAHPLSTDGNLTEDQPAGDFDQVARVKGVLDEDHFVKAAVEQWHDADDTQVTIRIFQFADADYAQSWYDTAESWEGDDPALTADGTIDGVDPSYCVALKAVDRNGYLATYGRTVRDDLYLDVRVAQYKTRNRPIAIAIMKSQYALLP